MGIMGISHILDGIMNTIISVGEVHQLHQIGVRTWYLTPAVLRPNATFHLYPIVVQMGPEGLQIGVRWDPLEGVGDTIHWGICGDIHDIPIP